jgi:5-formyltetrahydrofolate cyclo-ligase
MKQVLRAKFREQERNRPTDEVRAASRAIFEKLVAMDVFKRAKCVGAYLALPSEVQTDEIIRACWEQGKRVCVPYYIPEKRHYGMSRIDPGSAILTRKLNLREPEKPEPVDPATMDLILVPAMAFDVNGVRLGHGGGHYDRLLLNVKGFRLGLAFREQVVDQLPREPHDECVHAILSEQKLFEVASAS